MTFYVSAQCYLGPGAAGHFYFPQVPLEPPLFALAYPNGTEIGKHSLWTEWHGISQFNFMVQDRYGVEDHMVSVYSYWVRVQNEIPDTSDTFTIQAWRPFEPA
ncbi:hypothetical protein ACIBCO_33500 [Streptomyces violascens]|uniref:hypothetical protein n=1 Tax=Streptomyces violascens TaxID=67381 RepID=UPI00378EEDC4